MFNFPKKNDIGHCSFLDMVTNPQKRAETYKYYDDKYEETEEEKEIFELMTKRAKPHAPGFSHGVRRHGCLHYTSACCIIKTWNIKPITMLSIHANTT